MLMRYFILCLFSFLIACTSPTQNNITDQQTEDYVLPYYQTPDFKPLWLDSITEAKQKIKHKIDTFSFQNQYNETITDKHVTGKVHVANFFFSICPSICPLMINEFETLQQTFKNTDDVVFLSYTVDPENDTPSALFTYAQAHGVIKDKWHLLTGNKTALYAHARFSYFAEKEESYTKHPEQFLHTENTILVDQNGFIRGIYNGTMPDETKRITLDINRLLRE